jgi:hypothetical protein
MKGGNGIDYPKPVEESHQQTSLCARSDRELQWARCCAHETAYCPNMTRMSLTLSRTELLTSALSPIIGVSSKLKSVATVERSPPKRTTHDQLNWCKAYLAKAQLTCQDCPWRLAPYIQAWSWRSLALPFPIKVEGKSVLRWPVEGRMGRATRVSGRS